MRIKYRGLVFVVHSCKIRVIRRPTPVEKKTVKGTAHIVWSAVTVLVTMLSAGTTYVSTRPSTPSDPSPIALDGSAMAGRVVQLTERSAAEDKTVLASPGDLLLVRLRYSPDHHKGWQPDRDYRGFSALNDVVSILSVSEYRPKGWIDGDPVYTAVMCQMRQKVEKYKYSDLPFILASHKDKAGEARRLFFRLQSPQ